MSMMEIKWIDVANKIPNDGQKVWIIDACGFEYPATYHKPDEGDWPEWISDRYSIEFRFKPELWRPRD